MGWLRRVGAHEGESSDDRWFHDHVRAAGEVIEFCAGAGRAFGGLDVGDVGAGDGIIDLALALNSSPASLTSDLSRARSVGFSAPVNLYSRRSGRCTTRNAGLILRSGGRRAFTTSPKMTRYSENVWSRILIQVGPTTCGGSI